MIDTIGLNFGIYLDEKIVMKWEKFTREVGGHIRLQRHTIIEAANGAPITFVYCPHADRGKPILYVEFSLPHFVLGTNVQMVYNLPEAISEANLRLRQFANIAPLNLWYGWIRRLDICYNHQVGDLVPYYIKAIQHLEYPYRKTSVYPGETVMFGNESIALKFYDKSKKSPEPDAVGVLRQEATFRKRRVKLLFGKKRPTLRDITIDLLIDVLEGDLEELGMLGNSIATRKTALPELLDKYGECGGMYHYGLLIARMEHPEEIVTRHSNMHPRTMDRRVKAVADAIGPVTVTEREEPLPPLVIDKEMVRRRAGEGGLCQKFMGVTYQSDQVIDPIGEAS